MADRIKYKGNDFLRSYENRALDRKIGIPLYITSRPPSGLSALSAVSVHRKSARTFTHFTLVLLKTQTHTTSIYAYRVSQRSTATLKVGGTASADPGVGNVCSLQ